MKIAAKWRNVLEELWNVRRAGEYVFEADWEESGGERRKALCPYQGFLPRRPGVSYLRPPPRAQPPYRNKTLISERNSYPPSPW